MLVVNDIAFAIVKVSMAMLARCTGNAVNRKLLCRWKRRFSVILNDWGWTVLLYVIFHMENTILEFASNCCIVNNMFSCLQIIDEEVLCVHGGLSPDIRTIDQVAIF